MPEFFKQQSSLGINYGKLISNCVDGYLGAKFRYKDFVNVQGVPLVISGNPS